jgi:regulator of protease activity HflC (stomatin/prohibitin superfamily)
MEKNIKPANGYLALLISLVLLGVAIKFFITAGIEESGLYTIPGILLLILCIILWKGLIIVQPNHARVLNLFGKYVGSIKDNGMFFINPLYVSLKVSQRVENMSTPTLKVNDKMGNPVEIAAIVVWQIKDTYKAAYEVADYNAFVRMQSEAAVRALTMRFAYDSIEDQNADITLREGGDKIMELLQEELNERLLTAGIIVTEARISHLAYAQEIAGAMLQRQQASAIVAARFKIVEGAVGMVELALEQLSKKEIVQLDEEKKATMVSNLMVVLCGEKAAQPVINTGSLYQ